MHHVTLGPSLFLFAQNENKYVVAITYLSVWHFGLFKHSPSCYDNLYLLLGVRRIRADGIYGRCDADSAAGVAGRFVCAFLVVHAVAKKHLPSSLCFAY